MENHDLIISLRDRRPKGREGKGKDERVKREKIGRGRIAVGDAAPSPSRAHFDFPPFLRPPMQAI